MLLKLLEKLGRMRVIYDRESNEQYLIRYYLFLKDREKFPFNVTLHKILRSDVDEQHDHPWPFATLILKGGYYEWTPVYDNAGNYISEERRWYGPGSFIWHKSTDFHRLELPEGGTATTLFFMGPQKREWGFLLKNNTWKQWQDYLNDKLARKMA